MELGDETFFKRMQTPEEVQSWLGDVERELGEFMNAIPKELREQMDYSVTSLDKLEAWLLSQYNKLYDAYNAEGLKLLAGAGCYIGESIRKSTGAEWYVELEVQDDAFFGYPVLRKALETADGVPDFRWARPFTLLTASFKRRTGTFIRDVAEKFIKQVGFI